MIFKNNFLFDFAVDLSLYKDEAQLEQKKGSRSKKQSPRKRNKQQSDESDDEDDFSGESSEDENDEAAKKTVSKTNRTKKQANNKSLAIAKSVVISPSKAERALNRGRANSEASAEKKTETKEPDKPVESKTKSRGNDTFSFQVIQVELKSVVTN